MKRSLFVKIVTLSFFAVLMTGFVAYKSGAFTSNAQQLKRVMIDREVLHNRRMATPPLQENHPVINNDGISDYLISSSKSIVVTPVNWSAHAGVFSPSNPQMMISSSKTVLLADPVPFSAYKGIFVNQSATPADKHKTVLKQGGK